MTTTINASPTNGIVQAADGSGVMKLQSNGVTTNALAWAQFNGTTATLNQSYNVSSVTRSSTGQYTVNFTNALSTANYAAVSNGSNPGTNSAQSATKFATNTVSACSVNTYNVLGTALDCSDVSFIVFGQ